MRLTWYILACCCLGATGCMEVAPDLVIEGVTTAKGPTGKYNVIIPTPPGALTHYGRIEIGAFVDDSGGQAPAGLLQYLPYAVRQRLGESGLRSTATGKILLVRGRLLYYEATSGLTENLVNPLEEAITQVELVDKQSGLVIGKAVCVGRTMARLEGTPVRKILGQNTISIEPGAMSKADGLAKAITQWIADNYH
jgi:hypothetical protein